MGLLCVCFLLGEFAVCVFCLVGLLVAAMVEGFFFFFLLWFVVEVEKERDRGERDREREEEYKIIKKEYLNEVLKKKSFNVRYVVK